MKDYFWRGIKMNKKLIVLLVLVLSIIALSGCKQSITYSDKFEGIPIYPDTELGVKTEYEESYEVFGFKGTFEDVKEFYMENIDQEVWEIQENPLYPSIEGEGFKTQGYMLKGEEGEVSLIIGLQSTANEGDILRIDINGNPFEEGQYNVEGKSENWKAALEYIIRKGSLHINGDVTYVGDNPPKEVDYEFLIYELKGDMVSEDNLESESSSQEMWGEQLDNNKFNLTSQSNREYSLDVYEEAINKGYIEIKWVDQGEEKIEIVHLGR